MATPFGTTWPSTLKLFVDELQTHVPDDGLTLTASYRTPVTCRSFGLVTGDWGVGVVHLSGSDYNRSFMAVLADGTAVGYGSDDGGRLSGAAGQTGLVRTALGSEHCVGLKSDGTVVQWGATTEAVPEGLTDVVWVCAGQYGRSWAVKSDGAVVSWGSGAAAVLPESFTSGIARLDVGYTDSDGIAVKLDGTVIYWGYDYNQRFSSIPNTITDAVDARLCGQNSIILRATGEVLVYGIGRVGNQQPVYQAANAVEIAAKWYVWMVRFADGTVFAGNPGAYGETDFSSLPTGYRAVAIAAANYASAIGYDAPAEVDGLLKFEPVGQAGATKLSFKIADVEKATIGGDGGYSIVGADGTASMRLVDRANGENGSVSTVIGLSFAGTDLVTMSPGEVYIWETTPQMHSVRNVLTLVGHNRDRLALATPGEVGGGVEMSFAYNNPAGALRNIARMFARIAEIDGNNVMSTELVTGIYEPFVGYGDVSPGVNTVLSKTGLLLRPGQQADAGLQLINSPAFTFRGSYWDGADNQNYDVALETAVLDTTPSAELRFKFAGTTRASFRGSDGALFIGQQSGVYALVAPNTICQQTPDAWTYFNADATAWMGLGQDNNYLDIECDSTKDYAVLFHSYVDGESLGNPRDGIVFESNPAYAQGWADDASRVFLVKGGPTSDLLAIYRHGLVWAYGGFESYDDQVSIVLRSPDRSRWRIKVDNAGAISATKLP